MNQLPMVPGTGGPQLGKLLHTRFLPVYAAMGLALAGGLCLSARLGARRQPDPVPDQMVWRLTYDVVFSPLKAGARVRMSYPQQLGPTRILRESFSQVGSSMNLLDQYSSRGREQVGQSGSGLGETRFIAQFNLVMDPSRAQRRANARAILDRSQRADYLLSQKAIQADSPQVLKVLADLRSESLDEFELLGKIFNYCRARIELGEDDAASGAAGAILDGRASRLGRARAMVALCRASGIPARLVTGFILGNRPRASPQTWIQAYRKGGWAEFDLDRGYSWVLPSTFLPIRYDGVRVVSAADADLESKFSIRSLPQSRSGLWEIIDLTLLPVDVQETLRHLLLLAMAALVTSCCRNLLGIPTFTVFGPSLLAVSFVRVTWEAGLILFLAVMAVGVAVRGVLGLLNLRKVSRLSAVLVLVLASAVLTVPLLHYYGLTPTKTGVLLPMAVMTMYIERFHRAAAKAGLLHALKVLLGAILVAGLGLVVIRPQGVSEFLLTFPETLFLILAALVLTGGYRGRQLLKWWSQERALETLDLHTSGEGVPPAATPDRNPSLGA